MISFIIPAYNEEYYVGLTIDSINKSAEGLNLPYEIIVVNDNSSDNTKQIALNRGVAVVDATCRQLGRVRNVGASAASGDLFVFIDADTMINERVLKEIIQQSKKYKAGCNYGHYYDLKHSPMGHYSMKFYGWFLSKVWKVCAGYCIWCNASDFSDGFDEDYYLFEDVWFSRKFAKGSFYFGKQRVLTSGRKAWTHKFLLRMIPFLMKYAVKGKKILKDKKELQVWYDGVR